MRAMSEYRQRKWPKRMIGKSMLFFGARTREGLPCFGPLVNCRGFHQHYPSVFKHREPAEALCAGRSAPAAAANVGHVYTFGRDVDNLLPPLRDIAKRHRTEWDSLWRTPPSVRSSSAGSAECAKFFRQHLTFVRAPARDNDIGVLMRQALRRKAAGASQRVSDQNDGSSAMVSYTQRLAERAENASTSRSMSERHRSGVQSGRKVRRLFP
jgi:hypothetical protein